MASTVGPSPPSDRLSLESIPIVDLRLLSQSELTALSLCSSHAFDLRGCDDVVIPKIDRSVFNESAGSRKQTYSRLRLAPRNSNGGNLGSAPKPRPSLSPIDSDNSRIISLFKNLFNGGNTNENEIENGDNTSALVPVNVDYSDAFLYGGGGGGAEEVVGSGERKRKRGRKPKSETGISTTVTTVALFVEDKKQRNEEEDEAREKELVNKNGEVVNLAELGKKEDPYREEIRKRTEGRENPEELLGFITDLEGQWGSRRKKRKIVDANVFGDALPNGWKVLIAMKKKQGRAWLFCRRYISPNGRYFVSCKEVSSYLLSLISPEDLKLQIAVECPKEAVVDNKLASENATDQGTKIESSLLSVTPQCSDHDNLQKPLSTSHTIDNEMQLALVTTNVHSGEVLSASSLKCHKCSTGFCEKDELLSHLVSCHKRKRRKSGAPIEDDLVMKDGKYECQFCNKVFHERSSYFGHVGIHVKNYVKSIGGSPGLTVAAKPKVSAVPIAEVVPVTVSKTVQDVTMNVVSVSSAPNILASSERDINLGDNNPEAGCEAERHLENDKDDQNTSSFHAELNQKSVQKKEISTDEPSDTCVATAQTTENNFREVEGAVDFSAMRTDNCSGSEEDDNNLDNDMSENLGEVNATEFFDSEINKSSAMPVENDETCLFPDSKQVDVGNNSDFAINNFQREREASENDLPAQHNETLSDDQNSENRSLENNSIEHSCFAEGLELGDDDRLMDGSESGHFDPGVDAADDVQHPGSLDGSSDIVHKEEETFDVTGNRIANMESPLADYNNNSSCCPSEEQPTTDGQNYEGKDFIGLMSETEVDMCCLEDAEATIGADVSVQERPESCTAVLSGDHGYGYIDSEAETVPLIKMVEPRETGGFEIVQTCSLENSSRELSNSKDEEPKCDQVMNSNHLFFTPEANDGHLAANVITSNDQVHRDVSNLLGSFNNFVEDKQEQATKSILTGLSINEHMREVAMNNVTDVPSTTDTTQLLELNKVYSSRTNKLIFDFGNINEINTRFLSSVQNDTVSEGTSPFSLWGQQTCTVQDDQTRVYGGDRGVVQQERASDNNALNLVGLQQPPDVGYNLNKVCMNDQRYGVLHNETGVYRKNNDMRREKIYDGARSLIQQERASDNNSLNLVGLQQPPNAGFNLNKVHVNDQSYGVQHNDSGIYSKNDEARREGISHGSTLNLASLQQQCDAGYNLNKPCINQQNYGVHAGAYSANDESKQERVTCGNSLSLASVPQTCEPRYSFNKACIPQTCDTGFSLNKEYMGTMQGLSKLDDLGHSRDRDLMIGFGNSGGRPNQVVPTEFLWRATEGNILPGGLMDSSSSQGESSGSYQAFDFLSHKGGNDLYAANEKFDNISSFEGLRPTSVEPMEFSFMTTHDTNAQMGHQKVLYSQIDQGFGSSVWHQKPTLPNMMAGHVVSTVCVWCGNEFHQDSLGCEMQAGSIGYLCPTCKARMSGQYL